LISSQDLSSRLTGRVTESHAAEMLFSEKAFWLVEIVAEPCPGKERTPTLL
jgi:hypothetical protein